MHAGAAEGLTFRQARLEDEEQLLALDRATWSRLSSPAPAPPEGPFFNDTTRPEDVWVAVRMSHVLGYVKMQHPTELPASAHVWHCNGLAVDPAARERGVGAALMETVIAEARARGGRRFTLRVFAPNAPARRLYERLGFELEGTLRGEFMVGDGEFVDDLFMALDLTR